MLPWAWCHVEYRSGPRLRFMVMTQPAGKAKGGEFTRLFDSNMWPMLNVVQQWSVNFFKTWPLDFCAHIINKIAIGSSMNAMPYQQTFFLKIWNQGFLNKWMGAMSVWNAMSANSLPTWTNKDIWTISGSMVSNSQVPTGFGASRDEMRGEERRGEFRRLSSAFSIGHAGT